MNAKLTVALLVVAVGGFSATASANVVGCAICLKLAGVVKPNLENPKVAEAIAAGIKRACSQAQPDDRSECEAAFNKIVDVLRNGSPQDFCSFLEVCPAPPSADKTQLGSGLQHLARAFGADIANVGSVRCVICKKIAGIIKANLDDPKVAEAIAAGIEQACSHVEVDEQSQCKDGFNKVVEVLRNGSPQEFCHLGGVC